MRRVWIILMLAAVPLLAQEIQWPASFNALAEKASGSVNVQLDSAMLKLASGFLSDSDDEAQVKELVRNLRGIYVRGYEFDKDDAYSRSDLDDIKKQLVSQNWSPVVDVTDGDDIAQVFLKSNGDAIDGLTVVAAERRELVVVHILGQISVEDLARLGGNFGIPRMSLDELIPNPGTAQPPQPPRPPQGR